MPGTCLLEDVKLHLRISWNDEDAYISNLIEQGMAHLNTIVGAELDFEKQGPASALLLDYVRYVYNNASEYFEENFSSEILRLQLQTGVSLLPEDDADA